jgi:hypothetical protein
MNCRVVTSATETREVLFRAGKHRHSDKMANVSHHEYRGVETELHVFLTSALHGDEWSSSRPGRFTPDTPWIGGWMGSTAGLDAVAKTTNQCSCRESNPSRPARSSITIFTELLQLLGVNRPDILLINYNIMSGMSA